MRDEFLPVLVGWVGGQELPEEWSSKTQNLAQWRSGDRLASLVAWWRQSRLAGDGEIFATAWAWRKQYLHLSRWWRNAQLQLTKRIRERYRVFAAGIASRYASVLIEDFDLRAVAARPEAEDLEPRAGRFLRQLASPGQFRSILLNACLREGARVVRVPAQNTTRKCNLCGHTNTWSRALAILQRCEQCGRLWDQDKNAAANILASMAGMGTAGAGAG